MNLQLALQGASQGLSQIADLKARQEAAQIEFLRRENLMMVQNRQAYIRQSQLQTNQEGLNEQRDAKRIAAQHGRRTQEIQQQEDLRGRNELAREDARANDEKSLQASAQAFEGEYRTRAGMAAQRRTLMQQRELASRRMMGAATQLAQAHNPATGLPFDLSKPDDLKAAMSNPAIHSIAMEYRDAKQQRDVADAALNRPKAGSFASDMGLSPPGPLMSPSNLGFDAANDGTDENSSDDVSAQPFDDGSDDSSSQSPGFDPGDDQPAIDPSVPPTAANLRPLIDTPAASLAPAPSAPIYRHPRVNA
ncbi:MAG: hypothetical protein ACREUG_03530 [Steroidobacteraceae bacterium]